MEIPLTKKRTAGFSLAAVAEILLVLSLNPISCAAAVVTWQQPHNITQASDVLVSGSLVGAFNVGGPGVPSTTVNTVAFSPLEVPNDFSTGNLVIGNFTFSGGARISSNTNGASSSAPFSTLAANEPSYATLLQSGSNGLNSQSLSISGLVFDHVYVFQIWSNQSGVSGAPTVKVRSGATQVILSGNTSGITGGLGQFAIGQFVANSSFQSFEFQEGSGYPINAFQLRDLGVVPEPGTCGLLSLGAAFLIGTWRVRLYRAVA